MAHKFSQYWDRGVRNVPDMTGTRHLLDAEDIPVLAGKLGLKLPFADVLDVGCGTGRLSKHVVGRYLGLDISDSAVEYCNAAGRSAKPIDGAGDIPGVGQFGLVVAMSVFTHISAEEREHYLRVFAKVAKKMLVDIIPGDGQGDVALWTADPAQFESAVSGSGWSVTSVTDMAWGTDGIVHRYYYAERDGLVVEETTR